MTKRVLLPLLCLLVSVLALPQSALSLEKTGYTVKAQFFGLPPDFEGLSDIKIGKPNRLVRLRVPNELERKRPMAELYLTLHHTKGELFSADCLLKVRQSGRLKTMKFKFAKLYLGNPSSYTVTTDPKTGENFGVIVTIKKPK